MRYSLQNSNWNNHKQANTKHRYPDNKVHGANMGPTWIMSAPDGPPVCSMNIAIWVRLCLTDTIQFQSFSSAHDIYAIFFIHVIPCKKLKFVCFFYLWDPIEFFRHACTQEIKGRKHFMCYSKFYVYRHDRRNFSWKIYWLLTNGGNVYFVTQINRTRATHCGPRK